MSVMGVSLSSLLDYGSQSVQNRKQQFQQDFQQLGQDLQSGNLSAAQTDIASLQQLGPQTGSSSSQSNSPIAQALNQLSTDLKSGNVSAAQQDYTTVQKDFQNVAAHAHHHHHGGGGGENNAVSQLLSQLGQALQTGNLSSAQQAYSSLQQDLPQFFQNAGSTPTSANSGSTGFSASA